MGWKGARKCSGRTLLRSQFAAALKMISRISSILSDLPGETDFMFYNEFP